MTSDIEDEIRRARDYAELLVKEARIILEDVAEPTSARANAQSRTARRWEEYAAI